jgi:hypothetical protein
VFEKKNVYIELKEYRGILVKLAHCCRKGWFLIIIELEKKGYKYKLTAILYYIAFVE